MPKFGHGFSCIDSEIDLASTVQQQRSQKRITGTVFLDIKGAFDIVTRKDIFTALEDIGVGGLLHL